MIKVHEDNSYLSEMIRLWHLTDDLTKIIDGKIKLTQPEDPFNELMTDELLRHCLISGVKEEEKNKD